MELLTIVTLVYVAILVVALAASLAAILIYLRRVSAVLDEVARALHEVAERSGPLGELLEPLDPATTRSHEDVVAAQQAIARADARLEELTEGSRTAELKR